MDIKQLSDTVQLNCHISDARHAGNYTLCIYLLKMREFFRWERNHRFSDKLSTDDIGNWLTAREALWEEVENLEYQPVEINGQMFDPFESQTINQPLVKENLIYSGGYGVKEKPHFFLAELESQTNINNYKIYISGKEYARDLTSPPAMSNNKTIFVRRESFKRLIWERTDEWRWNKPENAMTRAIRCYDFDDDLEDALDRMTDNELDAAVLHEIGEIKAGEELNGWQQMMSDISFTQAEIMARAVRDHYADALYTLPTLIENNNHASIHFYFANLTHMRKHIFPALIEAYNQWCENKKISTIENTVTNTLNHWQTISQQILDLHKHNKDRNDKNRNNKKQCADEIELLVSSNHI